MEKLRTKRAPRIITWFALGGLSLAALTGCANYSGKGNEFVVDGVVDHVGEQSITTSSLFDIKKVNGDASDWFDKGTHQFHDNCKCHGFWNSEIKVGKVLDLAGLEMPLSAVEKGDCVELTGSIRDSQVGKASEERPVYVAAREIACPPIPIVQFTLTLTLSRPTS